MAGSVFNLPLCFKCLVRYLAYMSDLFNLAAAPKSPRVYKTNISHDHEQHHNPEKKKHGNKPLDRLSRGKELHVPIFLKYLILLQAKVTK